LFRLKQIHQITMLGDCLLQQFSYAPLMLRKT